MDSNLQQGLVSHYLQLLDIVKSRTFYIGRLLRSYRHYGCFGYPIGVATPYAAEISLDYVKIGVGLASNGDVGIVSVPVLLFESGTEGNIKTWITQQNTEHAKSAEDLEDEANDTRRKQELSILHELMNRYPEEAVHHE